MFTLVRCLQVGFVLAASQVISNGAPPPVPSQVPPGSAYFEPNSGSHAEDVLYFARGLAYSLEFHHDSVAMKFSDGTSLRMNLPSAEISPAGMQPGKSHYYLGHPRTDIPHFSRLRYRTVFPGIDMEVYSNQSEIEYDWIVQPGADPSAIRISFTGARKMGLDHNGDLLLDTSAGQVRHRSPRVYQEVDGSQHELLGSFLLKENSVRFQLGEYDHQRKLIIDPQIVFAAATGISSRYDSGTLHVLYNSIAFGIGLDRAGNVYVTGSFNRPPAFIVVTKLSPDGTEILYETGIATADLGDRGPAQWPYPPSAIACDLDGNVYVTLMADTASLAAVGASQLTSFGGIDVMVAKLDPTGKLVGTMVIGGTKHEFPSSITIGPDGQLYIAGTTSSQDFPTSEGAFRTDLVGTLNFFALKVNPRLIGAETPFSRALVYSALLGTYSSTSPPVYSERIEERPAVNIAVDGTGSAYVSAYTDCTGLMPTAGALQTKCVVPPFTNTAVVLKLNSMGAKILWIGMPSGSTAAFIDRLVVTPQGSIYVGGSTLPGFPVSEKAFRRTALPADRTAYASKENATAFVAKITSDGTAFVYATYLDARRGVEGLAVDPAGSAVVAGGPATETFPIINGFQLQPNGFLCALKPDGSGLLWSTFLGGSSGGIVLDASGNVYSAGSGNPGKPVSNSMSGPISILKISPEGAPALIDGVADSAAFLSGVPRPGGLASVFVHGLKVTGQVFSPGPPYPTELAGVRIRVGGVLAPIFSISNIGPTNAPGSQQVNIQVPFSSPDSRLELRHEGLSSFAPLFGRASPSLFVLPDGSGAIQHASDYSVVTQQNPARKGEVIIAYATGLGTVRPLVASGTPAGGPAPIDAYGSCVIPRPGLTSNVGEVLYAGLTPTFPGLYQVNIRVSSALLSGQNSLKVSLYGCVSYPPKVFLTSYPSNSVPLPVE